MFFSAVKIGLLILIFYNILDRRLLSLMAGFCNLANYLVNCRSYHPMILNITIKELKNWTLCKFTRSLFVIQANTKTKHCCDQG